MNNIIDNGETQIGRVKDIVKTFKQEMVDQINNGDLDIEELKYNMELIMLLQKHIYTSNDSIDSLIMYLEDLKEE